MKVVNFHIHRFRTFADPTPIPLDGDSPVVLHGGNGSGKSNALAALDFYFRGLRFVLPRVRNRPLGGGDAPDILFEMDKSTHPNALVVRRRDFSRGDAGVLQPMRLQATLAGATLQTVGLTVSPVGDQVRLVVDVGPPIEQDGAAALLNELTTFHGASAAPFVWLDARRRERSVSIGLPAAEPDAPGSPISKEIAQRLMELAGSLEPADRERWRLFQDLVRRFPTLKGYEASVRTGPSGDVELTFELPRKQVLRHTELSSGEQQVVALMATVLTARSPIVAIEEPEISLSAENQSLLRGAFSEMLKSELVEQIILESHVPAFDGPEVLRFERTNGTTKVERGRADPSHADLVLRASETGAETQWVSREGYTRLPEVMLEKMGLHGGAYVWFLRNQAGRWEALREDEVDAELGFGTKPSTP